MAVDSLRGGLDTARLSAAEQDRRARSDRQAAALRYLTRRGLHDVAEILGLTEPAPRPKRRRKGGTS